MNIRETAFYLLKEICIKKKYSNLVLRSELDKVAEKDKGLLTQIVYGTLQHYRYVRYQWISYVKKQPCDEICVLLDMSTYQLLCMDKVPSYAIVNEAVESAKKMNPKFGSLVNAILHQVQKHGAIEIVGSVEEVLAIRTSHPIWLVHMWKAQYGYDIAEKICESDMKTRAQVARVNTLRINKQELLDKDARFYETILGKDALRYEGGAIANTSYYQEGLISIQDEASQLVAKFVDPQAGESILDVCSAPGTKACHMAELMKDQGSIVCGDIHAHRVALIEQGAARLGITILKPIVMDATVLDIGEDQFDRVLCDVPCSGYGVLARKSDIKYHMCSNDMDTLIPLQQAILEKAAMKVKKGGILVYSTCTLNKKENEKQIQTFVNNHPAFHLCEEKTLYTFTYDTDGFYMAKLQFIVE